MQITRRSALALSVLGLINGSLWAQQKGKPPADKKPDSKPAKEKPSQISEIGGKKLQEWIKEIDDRDPSIRENAIRTIVMFGPAAGEAAPTLIKHVDQDYDKDTSPRVNAIMALGAIDFLNEKDVTDTVSRLKKAATSDRQTICRYHAALVLGRFGTEAKSAVRELMSATKDGGSWEIRKAAVFALARACQDPNKGPSYEALQALAAPLSGLTRDPSSQVRLEATMALALMGRLPPPSAKLVEGALLNATYDKNVPVAIWARVGYMARANKVTKNDIAFLTKHLKARELEYRAHAARALGTIGEKAKPAVPDLIKLLDDKEPLAQFAAITALGSMGDAAKEAEKPLRNLLNRKDLTDDDKQYVKDALQNITKVKPKPKK
jgi:HEAT repeat protein